ncbi:hypothetical protein [Saccharothrix syringae]|uniref:Uncharacterized protein n=1 Tax=Saccharothrix syringae TaxID=103733 RepID=A0A5Q0HCB1_SACSY|nr:hypothetical protein [Saccharothrix syringae]QFZ23886.1 hypothetical protein EKG83_46325 [Saccharothrix syringae]
MSAVDQRAGTGAGRVRRLLSRALLVVGGTLAGTAAAWALTAAPAAAAAPVDHEVVVGHAAEGSRDSLREVVAPIGQGRVGREPIGASPLGSTDVGGAVRELDAALRSPRVQEPQRPDLGRVAEEIRDTVEHVGTWFQPRAPKQVTTDDAVGGTPAQHATETTPATTAAVPVTAGTPVVHGVFGKLSRLWLDLATGATTAPVADQGSTLPGDPSGLPLMPFAPPLGAPAHCTCGGDASGSQGGGSGPYATASAHTSDTAVARALFPATVRTVVMPGKQPGITPD